MVVAAVAREDGQAPPKQLAASNGPDIRFGHPPQQLGQQASATRLEVDPGLKIAAPGICSSLACRILRKIPVHGDVASDDNDGPVTAHPWHLVSL